MKCINPDSDAKLLPSCLPAWLPTKKKFISIQKNLAAFTIIDIIWLNYSSILIYDGFHEFPVFAGFFFSWKAPCKAEQPQRGMELQEKETQKD